MTQQDLKQPYDRQNWQTWLGDIFGPQTQIEAQAENVEIDRENIISAQRFASIKLSDGKNLAVLDIEMCAGIQIARNRVGLRELVVKFIDHARYHGILAFYHYGASTGSAYRLSFISSEPTIDADGNFSVQSTAPKRYTYILGENQKTKTPADRLRIIAEKRGRATLEDIKDAFSVETLTKDFYKELSNWYFWALQHVTFPDDVEKQKLLNIEEAKRDDEERKLTELRNATSVIRLITRLMFVWFLKQINLIADELFEPQELDNMLNYSDQTGSTYYKAILQNLFFATLNTEMGEKRTFVNRQWGIQTFYRYERFFKNKERFLALTKNTPFLNGGLFENLDKNVGNEDEERIDCFSNRTDNEHRLKVPDFLFFSEEKTIDLNKIYDTKGKTYQVRGLIDILKSYHFTIEENTPTDIEVALDPELLGKVFENLLASYNPETQTTARKQTGSFYTPREIVDYMVEESLKAYLCTNGIPAVEVEQLFNEHTSGIPLSNNGIPAVVIAFEENNGRDAVATHIIELLNNIKVLDPACGSGAFPMGILQKMVQILQKLDPQNVLWKQRQLAIAGKIEDIEAREAAITNIEEAFEENELDYGRKLFLIENSIFGIDIQPLAVQISKLRFFISLICEQTPKPHKPNMGIRPLPNLETKFVAANTLIGLEKQATLFRTPEIIKKENERNEVRHKHFSARTPRAKENCRMQDEQLRREIANIFTNLGYAEDTAQKLAHWDPYDQNESSSFFDMKWMFGVEDGFDVVIGNPPYVDYRQIDEIITKNKNFQICSKSKRPNLYQYFIERGDQLMKNPGNLCYINPNQFLSTDSGFEMRKFLLEKRKISFIVDVSYIKVFKEAATYPIVWLFEKNIYENKIRINRCNDLQLLTETTFALRQSSLLNTENKIIPTDPSFLMLSNIENENPIKLKSIAKLRWGTSASGYGKRKIKKEDFEKLSSAEKQQYKPILQTSDTKKYYIDWQKEYIPTSIYSDAIIKEFKKPKIVVGRVTKSIQACLDFEKHFVGKATLITNSKIDLKILLCFLNSSFANKWYFLKYETTHMAGGYLRFDIPYLEQLPIPNISKVCQKSLIALVDQILSAKKENPAADTSDLEKQIDKLVYDLYGLTEKEIGIIER